jgi:hypothetical protein
MGEEKIARLLPHLWGRWIGAQRRDGGGKSARPSSETRPHHAKLTHPPTRRRPCPHARHQPCLGHLGREVETRLANLTSAGPDVSPESRNLLLNAAADAVWRYFIQREVTGLKNHAHPIAHYKIPGAVLARLGATPKRG